MKHSIFALFLSLAFLASLASCGDKAEPISPAAERGQLDAAALCTDSVSLSSHELTAAILAVRSREWQMRAKGLDADADAYIDAFRTYITNHNESLANELF